jgi:hypothetical protein
MVVEPYFKIDNFGRVICKLHSNYDKINALSAKKAPIPNFDLMLTCKTCAEYINDKCYFPKSAIDQIEYDRLKTKLFRCKLCGNRIDRMWTVIYKLYYKEKFHIEMPLICCGCHDSLKNKTFMKQYQNKATFIKYYLIMSIMIIINNLIFINPLYLSFSIINIVLAIVSFIFYGQYYKRLKEGRDYYRKYFLNEENDH